MYSNQRNATESALLKLPGELRNRIYKLVFEDRSYDMTRVSRRAQMTLPASPSLSRRMLLKIMKPSACTPHYEFGLLQTCLQTYTEAKHLPFALATLYFSDIGDVNFLVKNFTTDQRCAISSLQFNLERATLTLEGILRAYRVYFEDRREQMDAMPDLPGLKRLHVQIGPRGLDDYSINDLLSKQQGWNQAQSIAQAHRRHRKLEREWNRFKGRLEQRYPDASVSCDRL
jgi:hypothetical protein